LFVFASLMQAQNGHDIKIKVDNYNNDTLLLAYFYGDKELILDTVYAKQPGVFEHKGDTTLHPGVYLGMVFPSKEYFQFLVNGKDQDFTLETAYDNISKVKASGSLDNEIFYKYLNYIAGKNKEAQELDQKKKKLMDANASLDSLNNAIEKLNEEVNNYQLEIIKKYPDLLTTMMIKAYRDIEIPEFEGTEKEKQLKRYYYYKKHYFDNIDFHHPAILYTPFIHQKIETYLDKLVVPVPDSINVAIDSLLAKMPLQSEVWRYYVSYLLNKYARSNIIGMDAVYVHMAKEYYGNGLTPWVDEKTLIRILDNALRMESVLIGKKAPDIELYKQDGTPVKIGDIDAKYLVLVFWKPDCGHCRHAMPHIVDFAKKYKDKGVKVVAICTKMKDKIKKCWEGVKDLNMQYLDYNLGDEHNKSNFHAEYNIRVTPTIFVLDKDKKILIKQIPAEKLGEILDKIIEEDKDKKK